MQSAVIGVWDYSSFLTSMSIYFFLAVIFFLPSLAILSSSSTRSSDFLTKII